MQAELIPSPGNAIVQSEVQATPMRLLEIAVNQNFDIEKLRTLMELQERWDAGEAKKAFAADYVLMKANLPKVIRAKNNEQTGSKYAPLEDINTAIDPVLKEFGFSTATKVLTQDEKGVRVRAELWHKCGHVESTEVFMPIDNCGIAGKVNKTLPHAHSSSITYAKRIGICALLNISTGDDRDGNTDGNHVGMDAGVLREQIEWIQNASSIDELQKLSSAAWKLAGKDEKAKHAIIEAKDKRKAELQ